MLRAGFVIESKGLDKLIDDMEGYTTDLNKRISERVNQAGNDVVDEARSNHKFKTFSGQLEASITFEQGRQGNLHTADIYLNDSFTDAGNGRSYGTFQHEGTYLGYKQSPIAPSYSFTTPKTGYGIEADPFLWNAVQLKWNMQRRLKGVADRLQKKYERL